jgi:hypothetical protein
VEVLQEHRLALKYLVTNSILNDFQASISEILTQSTDYLGGSPFFILFNINL